jgi:hypothetical protein
VPKDWHKRDAHVQACTNAEPRYDCFENRVIDIEEEYGEAREEEGQRKMQENGQRFDRPREVKLVHTLSKECTDPHPLVWVVS